MRVPAINPPPGTSVVGDLIRARRAPRGLSPLDQALMNAPEIAMGWNSLLGAVRTKNSLPDDVRELMILRVAARNSAKFEWMHHVHVGEAAGLTAVQLTVIRDLNTPLPLPSSPAPLSSIQAAALRFADASTYSVVVPQSKLNELKQYLTDDQQVLEATAVVATYNMVSRLLVALDVGDFAADSVPLPETVEESHDVEVEVGVTLHVKTATRDAGAPWLVCINSLMTNQKMWEGVLPRLSKTYNLLTFDQRGHGKSSTPSSPSTLSQLSDDIATILQKLSIPTPIHAVIGVSQGGATAFSFASQHPTLYSHLIVCDTQATSPPANTAAWDERIALARKDGMGALADITVPRWFPIGSEFREGGRRETFVHEMISNTSVEGFARSAASLQGYDVLPNLATSIKGKKVLLMVGERDGVLPVTMKKLSQDIGAEFEVVLGAGHLPMVDQPAAFLDIVEKFLSS